MEISTYEPNVFNSDLKCIYMCCTYILYMYILYVPCTVHIHDILHLPVQLTVHILVQCAYMYSANIWKGMYIVYSMYLYFKQCWILLPAMFWKVFRIQTFLTGYWFETIFSQEKCFGSFWTKYGYILPFTKKYF